jgi:glyoxylase-like metal-dependent hydrolase (beta-lactamase superfamily II)
MRFATVLAGSLLLCSGCAQATPEQRLIDQAAEALGGRDRVQAVSTIVLEGDGENFNLGQNRSPDADLPKYQVTSFRREIDLANGRWRHEQTRTPAFTTANTSPQKQVTALDGDVAFNVGGTGTATRSSNQVARDRKAELRHWPVGIVRAALEPGAQLANARTHENHEVVEITTADGGRYTLSLDAATKLPASIVSMTSHPNLGDVAVETTFADYREVDGLKLPATTTMRLDRYTLATLRASTITPNGAVGDLAAPAAVKEASGDPAPARVTAEEVAPGIWYLAGQSHHSVLVEFADHLTLIEAPQSDARTLAVIAKARELRPGKPLTEVVNTHHHFDHSGGIRAAVSEGLTVITHAANRAFYEAAAARKHEITPDALAKNPKPISIQTVEDRTILKDASMAIELYPITGNPHADTLLMAYFPAQRLLVQADVFSPPALNAPPPPSFPFAANLVENMRSRNLRVERIVPIHGRIVPVEELLKAAGAAPPSS